jgi:hypothetical protein
MGPSGYPIGARVNIEFQTYQIMTKSNLADTFKLGKDALLDPAVEGAKA